MNLHALIRDVPDFPRPGIVFKDITPLLGQPGALTLAVAQISSAHAGMGITKVVGVESRGFILAPAVAMQLGAGFVPVRKPGKLPWKALRQSYGLEYGKDVIEIHEDALHATDRVLIVDDVLATGGTAEAAIILARKLGAQVHGAAFLVDLAMLGGAQRLGVPVYSVLRYT